MHRRADSDVLLPIFDRRDVINHSVFRLIRNTTSIFREINDRLIRTMLLALGGC